MLFFLIHSDNHCLLIDAFRTLLFKVIINIVCLIATNYSLGFLTPALVPVSVSACESLLH